MCTETYVGISTCGQFLGIQVHGSCCTVVGMHRTAGRPVCVQAESFVLLKYSRCITELSFVFFSHCVAASLVATLDDWVFYVYQNFSEVLQINAWSVLL